MMDYGHGGFGMMGGMGIFGALVCAVILIDLILVGVWLWQKISKK